MKKTISSFFAAAIVLAGTSMAFADPIEGNWKTQSGETAKIGKMKASGGKYVGNITDPADDKEYSGSATVAGSKMKMTGCALKIFCKTQKWNKL